MLTDPGSQEIVKAIVGLAHNLGMEVVGEGVETAAHLEALAALGCELAQGFHLSAAAHGGGGRAPAAGGAAAPPDRRPGDAAAAGRLSATARRGRDSRTSSVTRVRSKRRSSSRPRRRRRLGRRRGAVASWCRRLAGAVVHRVAVAVAVGRAGRSSMHVGESARARGPSISSSSAMPRSCIFARSCTMLASARSSRPACWAMRAFCSAISARSSRSRGGRAVLAGDGLAALD